MENLEYKLLLGLCYSAQTGMSAEYFKEPSIFREILLEKYPEMKNWAKKEIFDNLEDWPNSLRFNLTVDPKNIPGRFIAANLKTPTTVIDEPLTPEILVRELEKDNYTHVGISILVDSYSTFIDCTKEIRKFNPDIKIIAGNVGAMFEGTQKYVDKVHIGRGVPFFRKLFGENVDSPYNIVIIPEEINIQYLKMKTTTPLIKLITKIGCPLNCDFCVTNRLFSGKFSGSLYSPQQVYEALVQHRKDLGNKDFTVHLAEPTAIVSHNWWYELFDLFKEESGDYPLFLGTTSISLEKLDLDQIKDSALRIDKVNIGVESFNKSYNKNLKSDPKKLISKLRDYGIGSYITYIIGFDFTTKESVWDEISKLINLDAMLYSVLNLHPLPGTPIWEEFERNNRLLNVPNDFFYIPGFQPYIHPHFKPGFDDILPLLYKIHKYIERECGNLSVGLYDITKRLAFGYLRNASLFKQQLYIYQSVSKMMFNSWKNYFNPSDLSIKTYREKIDMI